MHMGVYRAHMERLAARGGPPPPQWSRQAAAGGGLGRFITIVPECGPSELNIGCQKSCEYIYLSGCALRSN